MRFSSKRIIALATAVVAYPFPASSQEWHLGAQAGRIRSALDPSADASPSFVLGLRYDDPAAGLRFSAGIPGESSDAMWGGVSGWKRSALRAGGFRVGFDVAGNALLTLDRSRHTSTPLPGPFNPPEPPAANRSGHAFGGQVLPMAGFEAEKWQLHARAGVSRYVATFDAQTFRRNVRLADLQLTLLPTRFMAIVPVMQRSQASGEDPATYVGASAVVVAAAGSVWGGIGQWSTASPVGTPWSAGARLRLHPLVALEASARHDAFDPLYLQPPQTSWSMGVSLQLSGRRPSVTPPVPAAYVDGRATIRLPVSSSKAQPSIAGDFNDWKPVPMQRDGDQWIYVVAVVPGVYNYAFVTTTGEWFVPETVAGRKSDGMGGHVAVLVVR
ncbi:MAG TPA: glycogen-binding domain-containing protein [Gemmatimonadaceae bacterium]